MGVRYFSGRVATVAVRSFSFDKPVFVGDLVSFYTRVTRIGTTSITVKFEVYSERGLNSHLELGTCEKVSDAELIFVALDSDRNPRAIK